MRLIPRWLDYSDRDFDALRARLIKLTLSVFPEWTDRRVPNFGNILLEQFAFVGDVLAYYIDNARRESRLVTAQYRSSVIAHTRGLDYRMKNAAAATAVEQFTLAEPPLAPVTIEAGSVVRTRDVVEPLEYQLLQDVVIAAGQQPPVTTGVVEHSTTHRELFDARAFQGTDIVLQRTPYIDGSATMSATNGPYTPVDGFSASGPNDRHFTILVNENDRATLRFGDGRRGLPPTGTVEVTYKTGGGTRGRVERNRLVVFEGALADAEGRPVQVTVTNPEPSSGGLDRESIASAKLQAPASLRATERSVAREDFEIHATELAGVARALMLTSDQDGSIAENSGVLYVIPQGGGLPTPALKNAVRRQITVVYPHTLTFQPSVQDPLYRTVDISARVFFASRQVRSEVAARIRQRLQDFFRVSFDDGTPNERVDFGFNVRDADGNAVGEIPWSTIHNEIRDTLGVRKIGDHTGDLLLNGLPSDVNLRLQEFPVLGQVTLVDGDTGANV